MSKRTRKTNLPQQSVPHPPSDWKTRAIAAVKRRDQNELEIAAALREGLEQLKETKWLAFCEQTWGWSRSTAYNHLNPALLAKDRARKHEAATSRTLDIETADQNAKEKARLAAQNAAVKAGRHWTDISDQWTKVTAEGAEPEEDKPEPRPAVEVKPTDVVSVSKTGLVTTVADVEKIEAANEKDRATAVAMLKAGFAAMAAEQGESAHLRVVRDLAIRGVVRWLGRPAVFADTPKGKAQEARRDLAVKIIEAGSTGFTEAPGQDYVRDQLLKYAEQVR